jgi:hypothetical protein
VNQSKSPKSGRFSEQFVFCPEPIFGVMPMLMTALCPEAVCKRCDLVV